MVMYEESYHPHLHLHPHLYLHIAIVAIAIPIPIYIFGKSSRYTYKCSWLTGTFAVDKCLERTLDDQTGAYTAMNTS